MNAELKDFIPDDLDSIDPEKDESQIGRLLKTQAERLTKKAHGKVRGEVDLKLRGDGTFIHGFYLVAPEPEDYRYQFLWIEHGLDDFPAMLYADKPISLKSEDEFEKALQTQFSSPRFRRLYTAMTREMSPTHQE